ncbi:phospholipid methyltransferase [Mesorhizobium sp. YC-39]|uniref:class I SAM-dependent methyltransferase n=1 Tax=unclassified Mesorhizobium TaxID=325217 RepID=UPI0021E8F436|nr:MULTISPECIES: phospholipid methyltransferase [unclassified Mesorhizobium]MCV3207357.1 phospholipid methyltransferase [Mesorhizobium sp. YC-2]MCV3229084.1 phospholipid methyltransferase [Mesorhizobium sp. YC-39]
MLNRSSETLQFFRAWLSDPLRVAAVTPSGRALAALIVSEVSAETGPILELGPGTGVFTRALLARGVAEEKLALIEFGSEFAAKLNADFPRAKTLCMDAARLRSVELFDDTPAGAVISGLPLLSMPPRTVYSILEGAFAHLRTNGAFYQFTYGPRCPVSRPLLDRLGLKATYLGGTFANVPPAAVYRIQRRKILRIAEIRVRPTADNP